MSMVLGQKLVRSADQSHFPNLAYMSRRPCRRHAPGPPSRPGACGVLAAREPLDAGTRRGWSRERAALCVVGAGFGGLEGGGVAADQVAGRATRRRRLWRSWAGRCGGEGGR